MNKFFIVIYEQNICLHFGGKLVGILYLCGYFDRTNPKSLSCNSIETGPLTLLVIFHLLLAFQEPPPHLPLC